MIYLVNMIAMLVLSAISVTNQAGLPVTTDGALHKPHSVYRSSEPIKGSSVTLHLIALISALRVWPSVGHAVFVTPSNCVASVSLCCC